jgi:hypothetical protein
MLHDERLSRTTVAKCTTENATGAKETGRKIGFSSRVEVRDVAPKTFGTVFRSWALVPLSLR